MEARRENTHQAKSSTGIITVDDVHFASFWCIYAGSQTGEHPQFKTKSCQTLHTNGADIHEFASMVQVTWTFFNTGTWRCKEGNFSVWKHTQKLVPSLDFALVYDFRLSQQAQIPVTIRTISPEAWPKRGPTFTEWLNWWCSAPQNLAHDSSLLLYGKILCNEY